MKRVRRLDDCVCKVVVDESEGGAKRGKKRGAIRQVRG
jgi:hypothetical protein